MMLLAARPAAAAGASSFRKQLSSAALASGPSCDPRRRGRGHQRWWLGVGRGSQLVAGATVKVCKRAPVLVLPWPVSS